MLNGFNEGSKENKLMLNGKKMNWDSINVEWISFFVVRGAIDV